MLNSRVGIHSVGPSCTVCQRSSIRDFRSSLIKQKCVPKFVFPRSDFYFAFSIRVPEQTKFSSLLAKLFHFLIFDALCKEKFSRIELKFKNFCHIEFNISVISHMQLKFSKNI